MLKLQNKQWIISLGCSEGLSTECVFCPVSRPYRILECFQQSRHFVSSGRRCSFALERVHINIFLKTVQSDMFLFCSLCKVQEDYCIIQSELLCKINHLYCCLYPLQTLHKFISPFRLIQRYFLQIVILRLLLLFFNCLNCIAENIFR